MFVLKTRQEFDQELNSRLFNQAKEELTAELKTFKSQQEKTNFVEAIRSEKREIVTNLI